MPPSLRCFRLDVIGRDAKYSCRNTEHDIECTLILEQPLTYRAPRWRQKCVKSESDAHMSHPDSSGTCCALPSDCPAPRCRACAVCPAPLRDVIYACDYQSLSHDHRISHPHPQSPLLPASFPAAITLQSTLPHISYSNATTTAPR